MPVKRCMAPNFMSRSAMAWLSFSHQQQFNCWFAATKSCEKRWEISWKLANIHSCQMLVLLNMHSFIVNNLFIHWNLFDYCILSHYSYCVCAWVCAYLSISSSTESVTILFQCIETQNCIRSMCQHSNMRPILFHLRLNIHAKTIRTNLDKFRLMKLYLYFDLQNCTVSACRSKWKTFMPHECFVNKILCILFLVAFSAT